MNSVKKYIPLENEEYMNQRQLEYFEKKLHNKRNELLNKYQNRRDELKENGMRVPDPFDIASKQTEIALDLSGLERHHRELAKIDNALARIKAREYGYCETTGKKIGLKRLEVQPHSTLCIEAMEMLERVQNLNRSTRFTG